MDSEFNVPEQVVTMSDGIRINWCGWSSDKVGSYSGQLFLLLHGLASSQRIWDKVIGELFNLTDAVILTLDQRGHGLSDKPDTGYTTEQIVGDVFDFADATGLLSEKPIIIGHSWGGQLHWLMLLAIQSLLAGWCWWMAGWVI